jgi:hypothetical protein
MLYLHTDHLELALAAFEGVLTCHRPTPLTFAVQVNPGEMVKRLRRELAA